MNNGRLMGMQEADMRATLKATRREISILVIPGYGGRDAVPAEESLSIELCGMLNAVRWIVTNRRSRLSGGVSFADRPAGDISSILHLDDRAA